MFWEKQVSKNVKKDWKKVKEDSLKNENQFDNEIIDKLDDSEDETLGLDHPSYEQLEAQLTETEKKMHENWEKAARATAELENVRRRAEREISGAHKFGLEKFINELLPVVDSLEQAIELADKENNPSMHEGLALTLKLSLDVLAKHGVEQINPMGDNFNPELHEAMSMQEDPDVQKNTVLLVFQKGYKLYERVIRPARVVVAK